MRRSGEGRSGATLFRQRPQTRHLPPKAPTPRYRPTSPKLRVQGVPCCHLPLPPNPLHPLPYPHAHPHAPGRNRSSRAGQRTSLPVKGESRGDTPLARGLGDVPPITQKRPRAGGWAQPTSRPSTLSQGRVQSSPQRTTTACCGPTSTAQSPAVALPPLGVGAEPAGRGPALPCFPLSISGHLSPRPSASVRLAPWQIRLVPLCRRFRRPPAGPSDHRPASAWQIRLVSLCRLVRRASIPSCAASPQAGPAGKNAQHNSKQVNPPAEGWRRARRGERSCRRSLAKGESRGGKPSGKGSGGCAPSH